MEDRKFRNAWAMACVVSSVVVLAYLGLVPLGNWQADEYDVFATLPDTAQAFIRARVEGWSPRPVSELLIYTYGWLVKSRGEPLVHAALIPVWAMLVAGAMAVAHRNRAGRRWALVPMALLAMFLLGHPVSELFYWPMGALAYLPSLAAIALVLVANECLNPRRGATWILITLTLIVAAASSEVGAMFVLAFIAYFACSAKRREGCVTWRVWVPALGLPAVVAAALLIQLARVRVGNTAEVYDATIAHDFLVALWKAVPRGMREWVALNPARPNGRSLLLGAVAKGLFAVGVYRLSAAHFDVQRQRTRLAIAFACLGLVPATIFAAYYQFGAMCCERHSTFRQCMVYVAIVALASWAASRKARKRVGDGDASDPGTAWKGPAYLIAAMLVAALPSAGKLVNDYRAYASIAEARRATWISGRSPESSMTFTPVSTARIVGNDPPRILEAPNPDDSWTRAVLGYFKKESLHIERATGTAPAEGR
jgi:hypothetical protein